MIPKKNNIGIKKCALATAYIFALTSINACIKANAWNKKQKESENNFALKLKGEVEKNSNENSNSMTEWGAFAIYHPNSSLNEDFLSKHGQKPPSVSTPESKEETDKDHAHTKQILGAKALIPILRSTFGIQIRGSVEGDQDSWFTTHPSALFTPEQMISLCDSDLDSLPQGGSDFCWKPKLSDSYLRALTDFASDACPKLVEREFRSNILHANKLVKSRDFRHSNLKNFAQYALQIPSENITAEWIEKIAKESIHLLKNNITDEIKDDELNAYSAELYVLTCQGMLISPEFYSR